MRRLLPRSLTGQTLLVLLLALALSHVIGITVYSHDRKQAVAYTEAHDLADRVVGLVNLLQRLPPEWRQDIVRQSDGRTFHVMLSSGPDVISEQDLDEALSSEVARYIRNQFPDWRGGERVHVSLAASPFFEAEKVMRNQSIMEPETSLDVRSPRQAYDYLHISVQFEDDAWLNLVGALPRTELLQIGPAAAYILSVTVGVGAVAMWLVFRVTAPLTRFARAADRLGKDITAEPLAENGPTEVAEAARAFNAMQDRLRRLIQNRTEMLAAISHDLRTPVTLLRLRAEAMDDPCERAKLLGTLAEMESMIGSVLTFTKATVLDEPQREVDLSALLGSICDDAADAGAVVEFEAPDKIIYSCRRMGLKRALTNLIDNAVKYGGCARVALERRRDGIAIVIDDDGPGIPVEEQRHVFMPFHRIEGSRNQTTGGVGLGLSIAQMIVHGHGGRIELANRPQGGLRVNVLLPA